MISVTKEWNPKQALFKELVQKPETFQEAMKLCLELHSLVHTSEMSGIASQFPSGIGFKTFEDEVWDGLDEVTFRTMPTPKDETIAWNLWHLTRIEDLTVNILIADDVQVFNSNHWPEKLGTSVRDTGNAMTDPEIICLSSSLNMKELRNYRIAVGRKTVEIINKLQPGDVKKKVEPARLQRILAEGGVLETEGSKWLLDFWGKKNIAGLLQMPITRHQIVHINDSLRLKDKCKKK